MDRVTTYTQGLAKLRNLAGIWYLCDTVLAPEAYPEYFQPSKIELVVYKKFKLDM